MKDERTRLAIEALKAAGCGVLAIHVEYRIAELEKDAARYRWLSENCQYSHVLVSIDCKTCGYGELDAAIDAAMQKD